MATKWKDFALEFYSRGLVAEAVQPEATPGLVDDMGDVIADMRGRLRETLYREPRDVKLLIKSMDALARALAADPRPRRSEAEELAQASAALLAEYGSQWCPYGHDPSTERKGPIMVDGWEWDEEKGRGVRIEDKGERERGDEMVVEWRAWE